MQKWEYDFLAWSMTGSWKYIEQAIEQATTELNDMGEAGWELVAVMPKMGEEEAATIAVLKRPKQ